MILNILKISNEYSSAMNQKFSRKFFSTKEKVFFFGFTNKYGKARDTDTDKNLMRHNLLII